MNKIINKFAVIISLAGFGCNQQGIPTYNDLTNDRYVYFNFYQTDSVETSFFFYPGEDEIHYLLEVKATGVELVDETYKIVVVEEETTAPPYTYEIPEHPVIRAGLPMDTCYVILKKADILNTTPVRLVIEIQDSDDFLAGYYYRSKAIIWFHNIIAKPEWWNSSCTNKYLGKYSDKKYQLFLDVIGVDLTDATTSELREYSLRFKKYLQDEKAAGRTVYEDDGTEMVVSVLGNLV